MYKDFKYIIGDNTFSRPSELPTIEDKDNTVSINIKKIKAVVSSTIQGLKKVGNYGK